MFAVRVLIRLVRIKWVGGRRGSARGKEVEGRCPVGAPAPKQPLIKRQLAGVNHSPDSCDGGPPSAPRPDQLRVQMYLEVLIRPDMDLLMGMSSNEKGFQRTIERR